MFGLREDIVDIPYDMISSVRIDKGVFQLILYLKLLNSLIRRRVKLDRLMMIDKDQIRSELMEEEEEEDGIITAFPRIKLENYWR